MNRTALIGTFHLPRPSVLLVKPKKCNQDVSCCFLWLRLQNTPPWCVFTLDLETSLIDLWLHGAGGDWVGRQNDTVTADQGHSRSYVSGGPVSCDVVKVTAAQRKNCFCGKKSLEYGGDNSTHRSWTVSRSKANSVSTAACGRAARTQWPTVTLWSAVVGNTPIRSSPQTMVTWHFQPHALKVFEIHKKFGWI